MNFNHEKFLLLGNGSDLWPNLSLLLALFYGVEIYRDFGQFFHPRLCAQGNFPVLLLVELVLEALLDLVGLVDEGVHCSLHWVLLTPFAQEAGEDVQGSSLVGCDERRGYGGYSVLTPSSEPGISGGPLSSEFSLVSDLVHETDEGRLELPLLGDLVFFKSLPYFVYDEFGFDPLDVPRRVNNIPLDLPLFGKLFVLDTSQEIPFLHHEKFSFEVVHVQNSLVRFGQLLSGSLQDEFFLVALRVWIELPEAFFLNHFFVAHHKLPLFFHHVEHCSVIRLLRIKMILGLLVGILSTLLILAELDFVFGLTALD